MYLSMFNERFPRMQNLHAKDAHLVVVVLVLVLVVVVLVVVLDLHREKN